MGKLVNFCAGAELKKRPDKANSYLINAPEHGSSPRRIGKGNFALPRRPTKQFNG